MGTIVKQSLETIYMSLGEITGCTRKTRNVTEIRRKCCIMVTIWILYLELNAKGLGV